MDIKERPVSKAKIEITLVKTPKFFEIVEQKVNISLQKYKNTILIY